MKNCKKILLNMVTLDSNAIVKSEMLLKLRKVNPNCEYSIIFSQDNYRVALSQKKELNRIFDNVHIKHLKVDFNLIEKSKCNIVSELIKKFISDISPDLVINFPHSVGVYTECYTLDYEQIFERHDDRLVKLHDGNFKKNGIVEKINKPKLAFFSPFPPERSGISFYSEDLIGHLLSYYDVELVNDNKEVAKYAESIGIKCKRTKWVRENLANYDRAIYHIGNSSYHTYMLDFLKIFPGVVVLHDFYVPDLVHSKTILDASNHYIISNLYSSHGYNGVAKYQEDNRLIYNYPCNSYILTNALGMIYHSQFSIELVNKYYSFVGRDSVIPLLRKYKPNLSGNENREKIKIPEDGYLVTSFGFIQDSKCSIELCRAFINSSLGKNKKCYLALVGSPESDSYEISINKLIKSEGMENNIFITGWVDQEIYDSFLFASDCSVQLRTKSRGETSAAALDCMNVGIPTIVNANGSFASLKNDAVVMIQDSFTEHELVHKLELLYQDKGLREKISRNAKNEIDVNHRPELCALRYRDTIEKIYDRKNISSETVIDNVVKYLDDEKGTVCEEDIKEISRFLAENIDLPVKQQQLLIDVSAIINDDLNTGIQRVVKSILSELLSLDTKKLRVEPIYASKANNNKYYYARNFVSKAFGINTYLPDQPLDTNSDDIYYGLDFYPQLINSPEVMKQFYSWKLKGVKICFQVYDLLPALREEFFPPTKGESDFTRWLFNIIDVSDSICCISNTVCEELDAWAENESLDNYRDVKVFYNHLGADIPKLYTDRKYSNSETTLSKFFEGGVTFLMVSTIEPRKGYLQVLSAFELLWREGCDIKLVIVGKEGWKQLPDSERRTIPQIINKINYISNKYNQFKWINNADDSQLDFIYSQSDCLISASEGEGFGLPLIEAAQKKLPLIVRDIPVFREVVGENATYFDNSTDPTIIAEVVRLWLKNYSQNCHISSENTQWTRWSNCVDRFLQIQGIKL